MTGSGRVPARMTEDQRGRQPHTPAIPTQRTAADAYRVTEEQVHRARMVVARNAEDSEDCRRLLDMLGLISPVPGQPPPVRR